MFVVRGGAVPRAIARITLLCAGLLGPTSVLAADETDIPSPSNYGGAGLFDMRTARFYPDGFLVLSVSDSEPDDRYSLTFQALSWAELTFRYSIIRTEQLSDRSFDLKLRLSHETEFFPEIALGLQDILGTGVYSGEYLVGTKRWGPVDFTLGLGWGRLGSRGTFENPFGLISKSLLTRPKDVGQGGVPLFRSYFRGPDMGLFAGFEYQTPIDHLNFKVEYSSDAYTQEKLQTGRDYSFPVNFGFSYRPLPWLDVGLSLMHGRYGSLRISALIDSASENWSTRPDAPPRFRARSDEPASTILQHDGEILPPVTSSPVTRFVDLTAERPTLQPPADQASHNGEPAGNRTASDMPSPPILLPQPLQQVPLPSPPKAMLDQEIEARIRQGLDGQNLAIVGIAVEDTKLVVLIENNRYRRDTEAIARAARVLSAAAPADVEYFEITTLRLGQPLTTVTLPRTEIDKLAQREGSPAELLQASVVSPGLAAPLNHLQPGLFPQLGGFIYPVFRQSLFDPDHPVFVSFGVGGTEGVRLARGLFLEGTVTQSLYDNFNEIQRETNSVLPHVRSDFPRYLKEGKFELSGLSGSYFFKLAPEIYGRVTGGYLEEMFAGAGGELLYRPFGQRWAIAADLWTVRQRDYHVLFDLRHYQAITGHITAYYELPWHDVRLAVSAGQYLAGDKGVTFEFSRRFSTGVQIGAWFTFTNVSAQRFGEGSFDKGLRIIIPFEWVAPFATQSGYDLSLRSIQRDGGQKLNGDTILYGVTDPSSYGALTQEWNSVFK